MSWVARSGREPDIQAPEPNDQEQPLLAEASLFPVSSFEFLTNHESMPVRRRHQKLTHAVRLVCRWLSYQRATVDELFVERVDVIDMQVSEIAVIPCSRRRYCIWTMANGQWPMANGQS